MEQATLDAIPLFSEMPTEERDRITGVCSDLAVEAGATLVTTTPMRLVTLLNRDVWRIEREAPDVGAALRATIDDCLRRDGGSP